MPKTNKRFLSSIIRKIRVTIQEYHSRAALSASEIRTERYAQEIAGRKARAQEGMVAERSVRGRDDSWDRGCGVRGCWVARRREREPCLSMAGRLARHAVYPHSGGGVQGC